MNDGCHESDRADAEQFDVVIIGAGFAGLYALHRMRRSGLRARIVDAAEGVGGTWFWNRYPGARCDVPSLEYSYSFDEALQQDWHWTERYASQPEIERYLNYVADRFDLRRDIELGVRVSRLEFDRGAAEWVVDLSDGRHLRAHFCVAGVGGYSTPLRPAIDGLNDFAGECYYTPLWPQHPVSFEGKRIGVVGTGSSGMQVVTELARRDVAHLYVFQRTPNYCVPANNRPMDAAYEAEFKRSYPAHREASRNSAFGVAYPVGNGKTTDLAEHEFADRIACAMQFGGPAVLSAFPDFLVDEDANYRVAEYLRSEVRRRVNDPAIAELLCAKTHFVGARRLLVEQEYFESYNQPNVTLVDIANAPIQGLRSHSLVTVDREYELDMLIFATGFDSGSGSMLGLNPIGEDGDLANHWAAGPRTFLGMTIAGFPNLFVLYGPGSPGIRAQGALMAEIQSDWVGDLIDYMRSHGLRRVEPVAVAEETWTQHVADVAAAGLVTRNDTTYMGANVPGKPRVYAAYLGGVGFYRRLCADIARRDYAGHQFAHDDGTVISIVHWSAPSLERIRVSAI